MSLEGCEDETVVRPIGSGLELVGFCVDAMKALLPAYPRCPAIITTITGGVPSLTTDDIVTRIDPTFKGATAA